MRNSTSEIVRQLATNIFAEGYIGVTFFFILSGFILSQAYSCRLPTSGGEIHDFCVARLARVVPLHLLTVAASIPLFVLEIKHSYGLEAVVQLSVNAALLQSFVPCPSWYFSFNAPSWSLSVELMFYALFPLLALVSNRNLIFLPGITLLAKICLFGFAPQFYDHFLQYIFPPLRLPDFVVGILASRLFGIVKFSNVQAGGYVARGRLFGGKLWRRHNTVLKFEITVKKFLRAIFTPQRALMTINADSPSAPIKST